MSIDQDTRRDAELAAGAQREAENLALAVASALLCGVPREALPGLVAAGEAHARTMPQALQSAQDNAARLGIEIVAQVPAWACAPALTVVEDDGGGPWDVDFDVNRRAA